MKLLRQFRIRLIKGCCGVYIVISDGNGNVIVNIG